MSQKAAVVYDNVPASSERPGTLFEGLKFWVAQRCPSRSHFLDQIRNNGGQVVLRDGLADHLIVDHARNDTPPGGVSYRFIENSIKNGELADPEDYATGPAKDSVRDIGSSRPPQISRNAFTTEDDRELYQYVNAYELKGGVHVKGNKIYRDFELQNPRHPWQSWRSRYLNHLAHKPPVGFVPANPPPSPPSVQQSEPPTSNSKRVRKSRSPNPKPQPSAAVKEDTENAGATEDTANKEITSEDTTNKETANNDTTSKDSARKDQAGESSAIKETVVDMVGKDVGTSVTESKRTNIPQHDIGGFFDKLDYMVLYTNAETISNASAKTYLSAWDDWAKNDPQTGDQWRSFWETKVMQEYEADKLRGLHTAKIKEYLRILESERSQSGSSQSDSQSEAARSQGIEEGSQNSSKGQRTFSSQSQAATSTLDALAELVNRPEVIGPSAQYSESGDIVKTLHIHGGDVGQDAQTEQVPDTDGLNPSRKRQRAEEPHRTEIPETQSQERRPSPKRVRFEDSINSSTLNSTTSSKEEPNEPQNSAPLPSQASVIIDLSTDSSDDQEEDEDQEGASSRRMDDPDINIYDGSPPGLPGATDAELDHILDIESRGLFPRDDHLPANAELEEHPGFEIFSESKEYSEDADGFSNITTSALNGTMVTAQAKDIIDATDDDLNVSQDSREASESFAQSQSQGIPGDQPKSFINGHNEGTIQTTSTHEIIAAEETQSTQSTTAEMMVDLDVPPPEGGWDTDDDPEAASRSGSATPARDEDKNQNHGPTPRRPVFDTQALLETETQALGLEVPESPDGGSDSESSHNTPTSKRSKYDTQAVTESNTQTFDVEVREPPEEEPENESRHHTPIPKRSIYDTQALLESNTQALDLELPDPPSDLSDDESDHQNQHEREASVSSTVSHAPMEANEMEAFAQRLKSQGHLYRTIAKILYCSSNYAHLANIIVESLRQGKGIPHDVPGVWTEDDDRALDSQDGRVLRDLESKHGWGRVEERVEFLRHYRMKS